MLQVHLLELELDTLQELLNLMLLVQQQLIGEVMVEVVLAVLEILTEEVQVLALNQEVLVEMVYQSLLLGEQHHNLFMVQQMEFMVVEVAEVDGTILLHMRLRVVVEDLEVEVQAEIVVVLVVMLVQLILEEAVEEDLEEHQIQVVLHQEEKLVVKELLL